ncbi:MAG: ribosomal protein S18 acetylase RimI-like enzyme [Flavobacteriales bacterium]
MVSPLHRGKGLGKQLIDQLSLKGRDHLKVHERSLFVMTINGPAMKLYSSLGYKEATYPEDIAKNMIFMVWENEDNLSSTYD